MLPCFHQWCSSTVLHINCIQPTIAWFTLTKGSRSKRQLLREFLYGGQFALSTQLKNPNFRVSVSHGDSTTVSLVTYTFIHLYPISFLRSVNYDRPGECSPEKDYLWWHWLTFRQPEGKSSSESRKRQSMSSQTVLLRTTLTWTIIINRPMIWLLGSNHVQTNSFLFVLQTG